MKLKIIILLLLISSVFACSTQDKEDMPELKIGKEDFTQININTETLRRIILLGGNGKYTASIANPNIASLKISQDTLKITGLYEGETYATIHSHNFSKRLSISVVPPRLSFSHKEVTLSPKDIGQFVTLSGGGKDVHLQVDDPQECLTYKWNANTNIIELYPRYEGDVTIKAIDDKGEVQTLKIFVKARELPQEIGFYSTRSSSPYPEFATPLFAYVKGRGLWIMSSAHPSNYTKRVFVERFPLPKQGVYIDIQLNFYQFNGDYQTGMYHLFVELVDKSKVSLRGKGYRLVLPRYFFD